MFVLDLHVRVLINGLSSVVSVLFLFSSVTVTVFELLDVDERAATVN